jgi:Mn2+/Fe2+ NRAMP family transporter
MGRYRLIQSFATVMVCSFTFMTVVNLVLLQSNPSWCVTWNDIACGLQFRLPPDSTTALATALATFGIIGVGASELITYPYWCLEKGYARFTGPRDDSPAWAARARGWMRVMRWDAWCSMVVYTFATMAFYLLGAAVLNRSQLNPEKSEMVRTLAVMYEPVFSQWASVLFLFGAFAVLYSTYFVANAAHARVFSDTLGVLRLARASDDARNRRIVFLSGLFPLLCLVIYLLFPKPTKLVLISGLMQAIMLPMLAIAGLYFRYRRCDSRLAPGRAWDLFLWVSAAGMSVAGIWALIRQFS